MLSRFWNLVLTPACVRNLNLKILKRKGIVKFGRGTYGVPEVRTFEHDPTTLTVGNYSSIASGVVFILGGNHPLDRVTTYPLRDKLGLPGAGKDGFPSSSGPIVVGSDVWIASNVTVLSGVTIGHGSVVCAGALVANDIPPFSIVGGVPARVIRTRYDDERIQQLLEVSWWEWSEDRIREAVPCITGTDVDEFLSRCR